MSESPQQQPTEPRPGVWQSLKVMGSASRGYWMVNLANFGDGVVYFGMLALMTLFMQHDVGLSTFWSTTSISWYSGAVTIFMVLGGGVVCDRLGTRRALTVCITVLLVGRIVYVMAPSCGPYMAVAGMALLGMLIMAAGEGVIQPTLYAGIKQYTAPGSATLGYAFLYSIMNLGIVAGELASPLIREAWASRVEGLSVAEHPTAGISGAFWFFIGITLAMLLANLLFFTRAVERRDRRRAPGADISKGEFSWGEYFRNLPILDRRFLFFIFALLPVRTLFAHQFLTMPDYVTRAFPAEVGRRWEWINGLNPLVIVVFVPLIAALTQKRRVVDMMIVGTAISAAATFLLILPPNTARLLTYVVVWSLGEAVWSSRFLEYVADIAPVNRVGIYMGIASIPWFLAKMTTGLYAGLMLDRYVPEGGQQDPGTMWLWYALIAIISPLCLIVARRWLLSGVHNKGVGTA